MGPVKMGPVNMGPVNMGRVNMGLVWSVGRNILVGRAEYLGRSVGKCWSVGQGGSRKMLVGRGG